jgi:hypothetical protein
MEPGRSGSGKVTHSDRHCTVPTSSTARMTSARSSFERGFMTNALMPASCATSGDTVALWPVQRMMGISSVCPGDASPD